MNEEFFDEDKNLSEAETFIMKTIWDMGGDNADVALGDLIETINTDYQKDYARTTIATFLLKLSSKGFVRTYRKGKLSFIRVLKSEVEYRNKLMQGQKQFWFNGNAGNMVAALCESENMPSDVIEKIRGMINEMVDDVNNSNS